MKAALALACAAAFAAVACDRGPSWKKIEFEPRDLASESADGVSLPPELWDKLQEIAQSERSKPEVEEAGKKKSEGEPAQPAKGVRAPAEFAPVTAYLYEKTPGALEGKALRLNFGEGGGQIDFARYLSERKGAFYVAIEIPEDLKDEPFKAYFLSDAPAVRVGDSKVGAGCGRYFDVTTFFKKSMAGPGMLLASSGFRHAYALGGTLFLAYAKQNRLKVSQLTFLDSRAKPARLRCGSDSERI